MSIETIPAPMTRPLSEAVVDSLVHLIHTIDQEATTDE